MDEEHCNRLSYLAGYVDGEACISLLRLDTLKFGIVSGDREVLELMASTFGGSVDPEYREYQGRRHRYFRWRVNNAKAQEVLRRLLPFLIAKRQVAERACELEFSPRRTTPEMLESRRKFKEFLSQSRHARFLPSPEDTHPIHPRSIETSAQSG